jgi:hypothetical protein
VIHGLESCGFCKEGEALDFIQDGRIELDASCRSTPSAAPSARDASTAFGRASKRAAGISGCAGSRQVEDANASFVGTSAPIVTGTTFIFVGDPY